MIIASGGQPTEQSQSSPNQTTHIASLRPLDLNSNSGTGAGVESDVGDADATGDEGNDGNTSNEDNSE